MMMMPRLATKRSYPLSWTWTLLVVVVVGGLLFSLLLDADCNTNSNGSGILMGVSAFLVRQHSPRPRPYHVVGGDGRRSISGTSRRRSMSSLRLAAAIPTAEESAQALTDYMAKAHEEKVRAMKEMETKFKDEIESLKASLAEYESGNNNDGPDDGAAAAAVPASAGESNSYAFPATNKDLAEKVRTYQSFLRDYLVNAQIEKLMAVTQAERKVIEKYETIIAEMTSSTQANNVLQ